jgi:uncharacterized protein
MSAPARAAVLNASPELRERTFVALGPDEAARLADVLRPLPWIDGLITAAIIAPEVPGDWLDHIWAEGRRDTLSAVETETLSSLAEDQFMHVCNTLFDEPAAYRPFLGHGSDRMEAVAQWAAGFRFGIRLLPEAWEPLIADDATRILLASIFCLERDEDMSDGERAVSPFHGVSPLTRDSMRRSAAGLLADVIPALNAASVALDSEPIDSAFGGPDRPRVRATRKIGRNEPCPCGSGKKYKKCCRDGLEPDE